MNKSLPIVEDRKCGSCIACCTGNEVKELDKAAGQRCEIVKYGKGCRDYKDRPPSCADFECAWLSGFGRKRDRPDKLGFYLAGATHTVHKFRILNAIETHRGAAATGRARRYIESLSKKTIVVVVCPTGKRTIVGGPREHIDMIRNDMAAAAAVSSLTPDHGE